MARTYDRLRETTFDLFVERESIPSYYRFSALVASWTVVAGYILFALAFSVPAANAGTSRNVLAIVGGILWVVGYAVIAIAALLARSLLFTIDCAVFPAMTSSFCGILITILTYNFNDVPSGPRVYVILPLIAACVTTAFTAVFLYLLYREVANIKTRDERRRWHIQMLPQTDARYERTRHQSVHSPEDEASRRQLARLLDDRREHPSMENMRGTYKIDLPGESDRGDRGRSSSAPARRPFGLANMLPWHGRRGDNATTFKDARELRREEIERSGVPHSAFPPSAMSPDHTWYHRSHSPSHSRDPAPDPANPHSAWGWTPVTRYA